GGHRAQGQDRSAGASPTGGHGRGVAPRGPAGGATKRRGPLPRGGVALACSPRDHLGEKGTPRHSRRIGDRSVACSSSISFHTLTGVASVVTAGHPGSPVAAKSRQAVIIRSDNAAWVLLGAPSSRNAANSVSRLPKEKGRSNAWQAPSRPPRAGLSAASRKTGARPPPFACVSARRTVNSLNIASPMIAL